MEQAAITSGTFTYPLVLKEAKTSQLVLPNLEYLEKVSHVGMTRKCPVSEDWKCIFDTWVKGKTNRLLVSSFDLCLP